MVVMMNLGMIYISDASDNAHGLYIPDELPAAGRCTFPSRLICAVYRLARMFHLAKRLVVMCSLNIRDVRQIYIYWRR